MAITLGLLLPIGSVLHSMLTESQFQSQIGSGWVLADGRSATGTVYNTVTGASTIPDMRAVVLRGKDNSRALNPDGDLALGTYQADQNASHSHTLTERYGLYVGTGSVSYHSNSGINALSPNVGTTTANTGGNEARAKSVTVNIFIRIN